MQIKKVSQETKEAIIHEREKKGPFISLKKFMDRTTSHVHLQDVRILIKAGCFDSIAGDPARPGLMWQALAFFHQKEEEKTPTLFDQAPTPVPLRNRSHNRASRNSPDPERLILKHETEALGFSLSIHPLDLHRNTLKDTDYVRARDLHRHVGKTVTSIGWRVTGKTIRTKTGETMKFISFEDTTGLYETAFFPKVYNRYCHMLNAARPYILKGKVDEDFGAVCMTVNWVGFLDKTE